MAEQRRAHPGDDWTSYVRELQVRAWESDTITVHMSALCTVIPRNNIQQPLAHFFLWLLSPECFHR